MQAFFAKILGSTKEIDDRDLKPENSSTPVTGEGGPYETLDETATEMEDHASEEQDSATGETPLFDEPNKAAQKSLDIKIELIKQQITWSFVIIGAAITIISNLNKCASSDLGSDLLKDVIICMTISFLSGIFALSIVSSSVSRNRNPSKIFTVNLFGTIQGIFFVSGVILIALELVAYDSCTGLPPDQRQYVTSETIWSSL